MSVLLCIQECIGDFIITYVCLFCMAAGIVMMLYYKHEMSLWGVVIFRFQNIRDWSSKNDCIRGFHPHISVNCLVYLYTIGI